MSILDLSFNKNASLLTCGTNNGFLIYKLDPYIQKHSFTKKDGGIKRVKILEKTNILTLIPENQQNLFILWDQSDKKNEIEIDIKEPIKNTVILRDKIIIVLERKICIFDYEGSLLKSKETYCNEYGLCIVNDDTENPTIVTLGNKKGEIALWRPNKNSYKTIQAHANNIETIAINREGTMVATASEVGTNIHVYNVKTSKMLYKFKRGTFSSRIYDMTFNKDSNLVGCCSENGTVHIFELYDEEENTKNNKSVLSSASYYIPEYLGSSYLKSQWAYINRNIGKTGVKMVCAFDSSNMLHIATYDGDYIRLSGKDYDIIKRSELHANNV